MAKQKVTEFAVPEEGDYFLANFSGTELVGSSETSARFEDNGSFYYFVLKGKNLEYSETGLTAGSVTGATFYDAAGHLVSSFSGLKVDALELNDTGYQNYELSRFLLKSNDNITGSDNDDFLIGAQGKDTIKGGAGNDSIQGDEGADIMTGGKGVDSFFFAEKDKKNVITDFDSDGPKDKHDAIGSYAESYKVTKAGDDTLVTFSDGSNVRLLDFLPSQLDKSDITLYEIA